MCVCVRVCVCVAGIVAVYGEVCSNGEGFFFSRSQCFHLVRNLSLSISRSNLPLKKLLLLASDNELHQIELFLRAWREV